ncbi:MAG: ABC transporter substrate-binding protein [Actinobacteria bacterium]|nr:ABC transporter substrate-binding protein [Actinomycetota bacterium]
MGHSDHETTATRLQGQFTRRQIIGAGVAIPAFGAVIAACGDDDDKSSSNTTGGTTGGTTAATTGDTTAPSGGGVIRLANTKPASPLDPIAMVDLGTYNVIAQSFEYLTGPAGDDIGPMLAVEWTPNADSTEWTFKLREGVTWHDGSDFTADDVVATLDRIATDGDGLGGSIVVGDAVATDPLTVTITLASPNASLPYLVSMYNPQSAITPKGYAAGTTLDAEPNGTGPWKLDSYDPNTGVTWVRNDAWWGGTPPLDGIDMQFFSDLAAQVTAMSGGSVDAIQQFSVVGGDVLINDENFNTVEVNAATHREIWMGLDEGQFTDKRVRQALALGIDRQELVDTLFAGKATVANDHVIFDLYAFHDPDAVEQRVRDTDAAKALLAEAGFPDGISATLNAVDLQEIPQLAELLQIQLAEAGFDLTLNVESDATFYGTQWCITYPCAGSAELGIVDYGHRPTPDVYLLKAFRSGGDWNSSQYASADLDAAILEYQSSGELEARTAACTKIEQIMWEDVPAAIAYRYNALGGFSKSFTGVEFTALGHTLFGHAATA